MSDSSKGHAGVSSERIKSLLAAHRAHQATAAPRRVSSSLGLSTSGRDGYLFVPAGYNSSRPCTLLLVLHAAGKGGLSAIRMFFEQARASGAALIPASCMPPVSNAFGCHNQDVVGGTMRPEMPSDLAPAPNGGSAGLLGVQ